MQHLFLQSPLPEARRPRQNRRHRSVHPHPTQPHSQIDKSQPDCTAKAVENRLYTWKKKNVGSGDGTPKVASTTKPATTPKTPKSRAKKQRLATPESGSPEGLQSESDGLEQDSPLASKKRKRATPKKTVNYKETSGEDESEEQEYIPLQGWRKVKKEPIEDGAVMFGENVEVEQGEEEI
jgi:hypothetical protein